MPATLRPAVFLDRDGTIVEDVDYLTRPDQLRLIPGAAAAIRGINQMGYAAVIVTNQSAVARGMLSESALAEVHVRLREMLAAAGAHIDGIYHCPHLPDGQIAQYARQCDCRKPAPGMLLQAARDLGIDLPASIMIGDSLRDLEAGKAAGCRQSILVKTGQGSAAAAQAGSDDIVVDDLSAAFALLIRKKNIANETGQD
ncbi:MAG TPA: D-glycero-beta-D-manno-heptose 1,7-bisphosphate 7-phosphatase [Alphaproteobacteria bacterium]|nr:D-glycero-beta-D-manno-heptose 1,7-bisphosphate 7-phosphatase [Alphaproteobacteria bacterium]